MIKKTDQGTLSAVKEIISACHEMHQLLKEDKDFFIQNNLSKIEENNQKKAALTDKINSLLCHLNIDSSKDDFSPLLASYQQKVSPLAADKSPEVHTLKEELKSEVEKCYRSILVNSNIVFANLNQLKDIWDQLLQRKPDMCCIYDKNGNTRQ